jgi:cell division septal protein FtsQ
MSGFVSNPAGPTGGNGGTGLRGLSPSAALAQSSQGSQTAQSGRVLDFRRRASPPRRRRPSFLLRLLKPMTAAVLLVALPLAVAWWVLTAPRFRLSHLDVIGATRRVPETWVRQSLRPLLGENLVVLPLADVAEVIEQNPWVKTVEIEKELPDRLRVKLSERKPEALMLRHGALVYADVEGRPIAPVESEKAAEAARRNGLLVVSFARAPHLVRGGVVSALAVAGELGRVQPDWAGALSRIEVLGEEDFRLFTDALPFPLLVTRGQVGPKAVRLKELLPQLRQRYPRIEAVDLRFSRRIVVQPANPLPPAGSGGATLQSTF